LGPSRSFDNSKSAGSSFWQLSLYSADFRNEWRGVFLLPQLAQASCCGLRQIYCSYCTCWQYKIQIWFKRQDTLLRWLALQQLYLITRQYEEDLWIMDVRPTVICQAVPSSHSSVPLVAMDTSIVGNSVH